MGLSKNVIMSAFSNFSTAYNLQIVSSALVIAAYSYPEEGDAYTRLGRLLRFLCPATSA